MSLTGADVPLGAADPGPFFWPIPFKDLCYLWLREIATFDLRSYLSVDSDCPGDRQLAHRPSPEDALG